MGRVINIGKIQSSGGNTRRKTRNHWKTLRDEGIQATFSDTDKVGTFVNDSSQF